MQAYESNGNTPPELKLLIEEFEQKINDGQSLYWEAENYLLLIDYYDDNVAFQKALSVVDFALQQYQYSATFYIRKAQLLAEEDQFDAAFEFLETATVFEPSNIDIYLTQSDIYMRLQEEDKALAILKEAQYLADESDMTDIHILQAMIYELKDDYKKAVSYLKKALKKDPKNTLAINRLWIAYDMQGNHAAAIDFYVNFINEHPYSYWAWYNLGLAYNAVGLLEKATEAFDYAIVINEKFEPAYHDYIINLIRLEKYDQALRYLKEYQVFFEPDAEIWYRLGMCYESKQKYTEARSFYRKALEFNTLDGHIHYHIGNCYAIEDKWQQACRSYEDAYKANEQNETFCVALADAYDAISESDKARIFYKKAIELAPENSMIWVHYIEFLIDEECYEQALDILQEARTHTQDLILDTVQAAILLESGNRKEGFVLLHQILEQDKTMAKKLFEIAPLLEEDEEIVRFVHLFE